MAKLAVWAEFEFCFVGVVFEAVDLLLHVYAFVVEVFADEARALLLCRC